jgi:hypothetical protein
MWESAEVSQMRSLDWLVSQEEKKVFFKVTKRTSDLVHRNSTLFHLGRMVWKCPNCSIENEENEDYCTCCQDPRPRKIESKAHVRDEEEYEGSSEEEDEEVGDDRVILLTSPGEDDV